MGIFAQRSTLAVALVATLFALSGNNAMGSDLNSYFYTPTFGSFKALVDVAQLTGYFQAAADSNATFTTFAPRNVWLDKNVDSKVVTFLKLPENLALFQQVVKFHVVEQSLTLNAAPAQTFTAASGDTLHLFYDATTDRATVEQGTPIKKPNAVTIGAAVFHGIDGLLLPPPVYDILVAKGVIPGPPGLGPAVPPVLPPAVPGPALPPAVVPGPALPPAVVPGPIPPPVVMPPMGSGPTPAPVTPPVAPGPEVPPVVPGPAVPPMVAPGPESPPVMPGPAMPPMTPGPSGPSVPPVIVPGPTPAPVAPAPAPEPVGPTAGEAVLAALDDGKHEKFKAALAAAGITDDIKNIKTPVTLIAPEDSAFDALDAQPESVKTALAAKDSPLLKQVLLNHVVLGDYSAETIAAEAPEKVTTLAGEDVELTTGKGGKGVVFKQENTATSTGELPVADPKAGSVHSVDTILLSKGAVKSISDIKMGGGAPAPGPYGSNGIIEALNEGGYTTLVSEATAAGLAPTIAGLTGEVTVLAPTNKAFKDADPEVKAALKDPELKKKILQHHIVPSYLTLPLLAAQAPVTYNSSEGSPVTVADKDGLTIGGTAKPIEPQVKASGSSSVIGIDKVLIPDDLKAQVYGLAPAPAPSSGDGKKKKEGGCRAVCVGVICGILGAIALLVCCWACFAAGDKKRRDDESGDTAPGAEAEAPRARRLTI